MRFKSDVGSSPPPFKRVVRLTRHWRVIKEFKNEKEQNKTI